MEDTLIFPEATPAPAVDFDAVRLRFEELRLKHSRMMGVFEANVARVKELTEKVALAKGRQSLTDEITAVLELMQTKAHARSVGSFEEVLTAVIEDNFPGKGKLKLDLTTERGAPALDLHLDVGGGIYEDILHGQGGAISNVVVMGLKYCALVRTKNRRVMTLDEPDIWLHADRVRNFFKVLADVTDKLETQTLTISHKDPAYFEGRATLVRMYSEGDRVRSTILEPRVRDWADESEPGIRYIHAFNVGPHVDTLVHFMPGLNALLGDNDLGKSTLISKCLRAVAYNEFPENLMRHYVDPDGDGVQRKYVDEAKIVVGLENNFRVEVVRKLKGSPKVMFRIYKGDGPDAEMTFEGRPEKKNTVPEAIANLVNIRKVDEMDFQLCWQKEPIFLLNKEPSVRARLLTMGRESGHLTALIVAYRRQQNADNEIVREGEAELTRLKWRLPFMEKLVPLAGTMTILNQIVTDIDDRKRAERVLEKLLRTMVDTKRQVDLLTRQRTALSRLPEAAPVLHDNKRLAQVAGRVKVLLEKAQVALPDLKVTVPVLHLNNARLKALGDKIAATTVRGTLVMPELKVTVPAMHDNKRLAQVAGRVKVLQQQADRLANLPELKVVPPVVANLQPLAKKVQELDRISRQEQALLAEQAALDKEYAEEEARLNALKAELGDCPLCGHHLEGAAPHAH